MSYAICRKSPTTGRTEYVAPAGSVRSFTPFISRARRFTTREQAEAECCPDNERIISL